jgi:bifunctional DNA-binding transcriptional regulator/antitoxin component of YhaV-PrlF toxin-antitoxin module
MVSTAPPTRVVRRRRGGQLTIPAEFRRELGIRDQSFLRVTLVDGELRIRALDDAHTSASGEWLRQLYAHFAPSREIAAASSEDAVNADIDQAVAEVRARSIEAAFRARAGLARIRPAPARVATIDEVLPDR